MQQSYNIDLNSARQGYLSPAMDGRFYMRNDEQRRITFSAYSPAYVSSHELVHELMLLLKPRGKTALAVAGSGDVPFMLTAYGAKCVDTFDISYNARVIMDIKTYMLRSGMFFYDYLFDLDCLKNNSATLLDSRFTKIVRHAVTSETWKYLDGMRGCQIFRPVKPDTKEFYPNMQEFENMQRNVNERYNFIWTDAFNICDHISGKTYDIIYLSNVFQYFQYDDDIRNLLCNLRHHVNPNGVIVIDSLLWFLMSMRMEKYQKITKDFDWAEFVCSGFARTAFLKVK